MRPFFSVIIPCYNSKPERIRELFDSIIKAGYNRETEVIISDDRSTNKTYLTIVEEYRNKLNNIKIISVPDINEDGIKLIHCPSNTREYGVKNAEGEWITFIDHDDIFENSIFTNIKNLIKSTKEKYLVYNNFKIYNTTTKETKYLTDHGVDNWMHGKFYNLDNYWNRFDFHFKTNIKSHEDIVIASKVRCINNKHLENILYTNYCAYIWRKWPDSLSHMRSNNGEDYVKYMYDYFEDFVNATMGIYIEDYENLINNRDLSEKSKEFHKDIQADIILFIYFYIQGFKYRYRNNINTNYEALAKKYIHEYLDRFEMLPCNLYNYICETHSTGYELWYTTVRNSVYEAFGCFVETDTFYDFISK